MARRERGLTLIELMIVIAIIGILAAVAVFMFTKSKKKAQTSEVYAMFAEFQNREEAYAVENEGRYLATGASDTDYYPVTPAGSGTPQPLDIPTAAPDAWRDLRMEPDITHVRCAYVAMAGGPTDDALIGTNAQEFGLAAAPNRNWYYLVAECDFDDDSTVNSRYFKSSTQDTVQKRDPGR